MYIRFSSCVHVLYIVFFCLRPSWKIDVSNEWSLEIKDSIFFLFFFILLISVSTSSIISVIIIINDSIVHEVVLGRI